MLSINVSQFATGYYLIFQCVTNNLGSSELIIIPMVIAAKGIDGPSSMADVECSCGEAAMEMIIVSNIKKTAKKNACKP